MALDLAALRFASAQATSAASELEYSGNENQAAASLEAYLSALRIRVSAEPEQVGWIRVLGMVVDLSRRLALDTLAPDRLSHLRTRVYSLLDLPAVLTVGAMSDLHSPVEAAIEVGAPRYNAGDVRGCCIVYWATANTLAAARAVRGFTGYARALVPLRHISDAPVPTTVLDPASLDNYAWALRYALDAVLAIPG